MGMTLKKEEFKFPVRKTKHSFPDFHIAPIPEIGMEILAVGFVKLKDIDAKHANLARKTGVLSTHVSELSKLIDNGLYKGWANEPPVINTEGKLIAGKHTREINRILGSKDYDEIIHRNNFLGLN